MVVELSDVHAALENDEIVPYFQPLVELRTGRLTGFEVLARWQHPIEGPILPSNFIAMAEENGLIGKLSLQIFHKAFLAAAFLPDPLVLAVNISPSQMHHSTLPAQIAEVALKTGFPLRRLTIEVTESALLHDLAESQKVAAGLKEMGCRLALDDFGTGYSSLAHLQALPFDELKIDRTFVSSMTNTRESRKIVAAIIGLAHSLGIITVAEGVETEAQADMLLCLGSELGQGWLYGRPVAAEKLAELAAAPPRMESPTLSNPGDGWAVSSLEALPTQRLAQLQAIYDGSPVGLAFLDRDFRYVSINKKLAEMNGKSVQAHLGKTVKELYPNAFKAYEPYLLRALEGEAIQGVEITRPALLPGHTSEIINASYQPAWDEADEVIGVSIAILDITAKRYTEEALVENEQYEKYLASRGLVPWIMDAAGNNIPLSSQWLRSEGRTAPFRPNLSWLEALHIDDLGPTFRVMKEALRTGEPIDVQYRVCVDHEWQRVRSRGSPRLGSNGEIVRWYGTVENMEVSSRLEEEHAGV